MSERLKRKHDETLTAATVDDTDARGPEEKKIRLATTVKPSTSAPASHVIDSIASSVSKKKVEAPVALEQAKILVKVRKCKKAATATATGADGKESKDGKDNASASTSSSSSSSKPIRTAPEIKIPDGAYKDMELKYLAPKWHTLLKDVFTTPEWARLVGLLNAEAEKGTRICPPLPLVFNGFNLCPPEHVKVVIIGQDPYHGPGQAHGLSFSVPKPKSAPPSLEVIYTELERSGHKSFVPAEILRLPKTALPGFFAPHSESTFPLPEQWRRPSHGCLEAWAKRGVLLINSTLTVTEGRANSHESFKWSNFTDRVIETLSDTKSGLVFMLWGSFAKRKKPLIDIKKHLVLEAGHPSPANIDASTSFLGCRHFVRANEYLASQGSYIIDWTLGD